MSKQFRVSRHGLTECPSCGTHIALAKTWTQTQCRFCSAKLLSAEPRSPLQRLLLKGTITGAMAASLLGLGLSGCGPQDNLQPLPEPQADVGPAVPLYGLPPPDVGLVDAGEPIPQPEYGLPPPVDGGGADVQLVDAGEPIPQPEYGLPPAFDATVMDAAGEDATPATPLYGLAPALDGGVGDVS